jgi:hypothetical protein
MATLSSRPPWSAAALPAASLRRLLPLAAPAALPRRAAPSDGGARRSGEPGGGSPGPMAQRHSSLQAPRQQLQQQQRQQQQQAPAQPPALAQPQQDRKILSDAQLLRYEREGWLATRSLLRPADVAAAATAVDAAVTAGRLAALRQRVRVLCPGVDPAAIADEAAALRALRRRGTDAIGFLQFFHLHRSSDAVRALVAGPALAGVAAQLLGARRVRLYQDCVFAKEPGFAETNWRAALARSSVHRLAAACERGGEQAAPAADCALPPLTLARRFSGTPPPAPSQAQRPSDGAVRHQRVRHCLDPAAPDRWWRRRLGPPVCGWLTS